MNQNSMDYEVYKEIEFEDVPSDFRFLHNNKMIVVALNSGTIVTMLACSEINNEFVMSQQIKLFGLLGLWNDLKLQMFNNNRYFFTYQRGHHLFNPNAHTELLLFSINQKHVQKVDSYGLVEHFWTPNDIGVIAIAEKEDPSAIKIIDLKQDFKIPQMQEICERISDVVQAKGSVQRTEDLFRLHKSVLNYLTDETRMRVLEQDQNQEGTTFLGKEGKKCMVKIDDIAKRMLRLKKNDYRPWNRFRDEVKVHNQFNLPYYGVSVMNMDFLSYIWKQYGYRPLYSPEGYDPFDRALWFNDIDVLNSMAEGFQDPKNMAYLLSRMDLEMFVKIMNSESSMLKRVVMKACFVEPVPLKTHINQSFPFISDDDSFLVFRTQGLNFTRKLSCSIDKVFRSRKGIHQTPVKALIFRFLFNPSFGSKSAHLLLQAYKGMPADLKTNDYSRIIKYLWKMNCHFICFYSFFVILTTGLFHAYITWHPENLYLAVIILINCAMLLFYEGVNYAANPKDYFDSGYNYLDLYIYLARPAIIVLKMLSVLNEGENELVKAWVNVTLMIAGFRSMGELRVFSSTRVLMAMISQVVYDMVAFTIITIGMLVVFSLVSANINKFEPEASIGSLNSFALLMNHYYNIAAGQWDESIDNLNLSEVINFYISGIALFILMINLLIAVISLTFDEFLETKEFCDLEQLYDVMNDHCTFIGVVQKIFRKLFGMRKGTNEVTFHHCFMIQEEEREGNRTQEGIDNLNLRMEMINETVKVNFRRMMDAMNQQGAGVVHGFDDGGEDDETHSLGVTSH